MNTSSFLNATIDKELYQKTLTNLNKNLIDGVELNIAEELLKSHEKNNKILMT